MRYRRVEEGIARAVRQAVHYTPEILNPLSAALIGASGFVNGHIRWILLILGVCCLLAGTVLGKKRDHDNEREILERQKSLEELGRNLRPAYSENRIRWPSSRRTTRGNATRCVKFSSASHRICVTSFHCGTSQHV